MYLTDELIYIQMQKTGCTHIANLLSEFYPGEQTVKHNAATKEQLQSGRYIISSIRDPWDWYLSLWTFGVQRKGGLLQRLTSEHYSGPLPENRNPEFWQELYSRNDDVMAFRNWLQMIHAPQNSYYLGEDYGKTTITNLCGFMTFRYLYLCCQNIELLYKPNEYFTPLTLKNFDVANCYIDFFIRQESLEADLCEALSHIRRVTSEQRDYIFERGKSNISIRKYTLGNYYDQNSVDLVMHRDALIINRFNYSPP